MGHLPVFTGEASPTEKPVRRCVCVDIVGFFACRLRRAGRPISSPFTELGGLNAFRWGSGAAVGRRWGSNSRSDTLLPPF
eukprot:3122876-Pyramimonas_sp.AAC.2